VEPRTNRARPDSNIEGFRAIVLDADGASELQVLGELVAVLG
jgi:hypothetical protein